MRVLLSFFATLLVATLATAGDLPDYPSADEIRDHAFASNDREAMAGYLLDDYAKALGHLNICGRGRSNDLENLSAEIAEWSRPGLWAWISGEQDDRQSWILNSAELSHAAARATANCDNPAMLMVQSEIANRLKRELRTMMLTPP